LDQWTRGNFRVLRHEPARCRFGSTHTIFRNVTFCGYGLRLVLGPLASAGAAAKLCTMLERFRLTCQPTIFAGRHLALD